MSPPVGTFQAILDQQNLVAEAGDFGPVSDNRTSDAGTPLVELNLNLTVITQTVVGSSGIAGPG